LLEDKKGKKDILKIIQIVFLVFSLEMGWEEAFGGDFAVICSQ